ncbi:MULTISPECIES: copper-resistant cuproprotein CopI [Pseudomonas]|uniref:Putative blue copper protein n=1 Tax=Pseudomonas fluorescens (strain Pf0-1) TaxID=205922 RepID=Q3K9G3_PSEPF|nr:MULTISPECIES: cupredoxin family protein [Pseudomonas]ABA75591.1 putative blue copper protein [Pseudomonas fluorescens Pf0-1]MBL0798840.1 cupredoxin family protein [Pseudomonas sp. B7]MBX8620446.1 cupredoxin family protein [Pseudomonas glycinae]MBY9025827.1 cupredoxin family protein [Pseudomonas fluorescens]MBY9033254.1 cupredoxin family protein [Pseudomonas fluorescens]
MFLRNRLALAACLLALSSPLWASPAHTYDFGQPAPAAKATRSIEVVMGDMSFDPKAIEIKAGETVRFVLVNKGQLLHEFNLGDATMHAKHQQEMLQMQQSGMLTPTGMKEMSHDMAGMDHAAMGHGMKHDDPNSVLVEPGKTAELTWTFSKAVNLEFACNIPGHYQAGMVGKLTVSQ